MGGALRGRDRTALVIAPGERLAPAIVEDLREHGLAAELVTVEVAATQVVERAPDLIVVGGSAVRDGRLLDAITARAAGARIVVIAGEHDPPARDSDVFATVPRTASAHALARRIVRAVEGEGGAEITQEVSLDDADASVSMLLAASGMEPSADDERAHLRGRRILLVARDVAKSDVIAEELRSAGAIVVVGGGAGGGLPLARTLIPEVVIVDASGPGLWATPALDAIRRELVLRWAPIYPIDLGSLWRGSPIPDVSLLGAPIRALLSQDRALAERAVRGEALTFALERIGPVRALRALANTGVGLRARVEHPRVLVEVDLAEGVVAGALALEPRGDTVIAEGTAALALLLDLSRGRVTVTPVAAPRSVNVMALLEDAVQIALCESAAPVERSPSVPSHDARDPTAELLLEVEHLIATLRTVDVPRRPRAREQVAPAHLPVIGAVVEDDEPATGRYAPEQMERLRCTMRGAEATCAPIVVAVEATADTCELPPSTTAGERPPHTDEAGVERRLLRYTPNVRRGLLITASCGAFVLALLSWWALSPPRAVAPIPPRAESRGRGPSRHDAPSLAPTTFDRAATERPAHVGPAPGELLEGDASDFDLSLFGGDPDPHDRALPREVLIRRANAARTAGRFDDARRLSRALLAIDLDNPRAAAGLARLYMDHGDGARGARRAAPRSAARVRVELRAPGRRAAGRRERRRGAPRISAGDRARPAIAQRARAARAARGVRPDQSLPRARLERTPLV